MDVTELEPTIKEIDDVLTYLHKLLIDPKLNERRRILILKEVDDLLDDRLQTSRPS